MKEIERISEIKESLIWVEEISWKLTEPELLDKILLTMVSAQKNYPDQVLTVQATRYHESYLPRKLNEC